MSNNQIQNVNYDQHIRPLIGFAGSYETLLPVITLAAYFVKERGLGEKDAWMQATRTFSEVVTGTRAA